MAGDLADHAVGRAGIARFGPYELDSRCAELRKSGLRLRLQEQPVRLLLVLLERAGELVTREELRERLWSADTYVDFDHSLNTAVRKLRSALNDSAETPRFIETVARRGYRFIAPVEWIAGRETKPEVSRHRSPVMSALAAAWQRRSVRLTVAVSLVAVVAAVLIGGTWLIARSRLVRDPPTFQLVTDRRGGIWFAQFAAGNQVVYSGDYDGPAPRIYVSSPGSSRERSIGSPGMVLWAVSRTNELAVRLDPIRGIRSDLVLGTLARMPLDGGGPKKVIDRVMFATWMPDGNLAAMRVVGGRARFEMPIGNVIDELREARSISVSPDGKHVAWLESVSGVGAVVISDRKGRVVRRVEGHSTIRGNTVWSPDSRTVWFNDRGIDSTSIWSFDIAANRTRTVMRLPGAFAIHDIAENGDALLENWDRSDETYAVNPAGVQHDLSRSKNSLLGDLSPDGKVAVVTQNWWPVEGTTFLHATDGGPPVRIEEGTGSAISRDGRRVLVVQKSRIVIAPVGVGQTVALPAFGLSGFGRADWMPDGQQVVFTAARGDAAPRIWLQAIAGGAPKAITPAGVTMPEACRCVSPDGRWIVAEADGRLLLFSVDGRQSREIKGIAHDEQPFQFSPDGRSLFVARIALPSTIMKMDLATGDRTVWKPIVVTDPVGARSLLRLRIADDGSFAYTVLRGLSRLYIVRGLR